MRVAGNTPWHARRSESDTTQFERWKWKWKYSDRPGTAKASNDGFELCQLARVIQASGDLFTGKIGKVHHDLLQRLAGSQMPEYQADRDTCAFNPRFAPQDFRIAYDVLFPFHGHALILTPLPRRGKGWTPEIPLRVRGE